MSEAEQASLAYQSFEGSEIMPVLNVVANFFISALLIGGLVYLGYVELCRNKESLVGLSTWAFAFLPFSGFLGGIACIEIVWLPVRAGLIILLAAGAWNFMSQLFKKARTNFR
jgi:hypothetical protein